MDLFCNPLCKPSVQYLLSSIYRQVAEREKSSAAPDCETICVIIFSWIEESVNV